jgi:hypothetical protein
VENQIGDLLNRRISRRGTHLSASSSFCARTPLIRHLLPPGVHVECDNRQQKPPYLHARRSKPTALSIPTTPPLSGAPRRSPAPPSPSAGQSQARSSTPSYSPTPSPILVVPDKFTPTPVIKASTTTISRAIERRRPLKCSTPSPSAGPPLLSQTRAPPHATSGRPPPCCCCQAPYRHPSPSKLQSRWSLPLRRLLRQAAR